VCVQLTEEQVVAHAPSVVPEGRTWESER
jgi:hypothetical protein